MINSRPVIDGEVSVESVDRIRTIGLLTYMLDRFDSIGRANDGSVLEGDSGTIGARDFGLLLVLNRSLLAHIV